MERGKVFMVLRKSLLVNTLYGKNTACSFSVGIRQVSLRPKMRYRCLATQRYTKSERNLGNPSPTREAMPIKPPIFTPTRNAAADRSWIPFPSNKTIDHAASPSSVSDTPTPSGSNALAVSPWRGAKRKYCLVSCFITKSTVMLQRLQTPSKKMMGCSSIAMFRLSLIAKFQFREIYVPSWKKKTMK